jgi:hypothetical protein
MIVGRHPRNPVIGDTVLSRSDRRHGTGVIVDTDAIRYKVYWRDGRDTLLTESCRSSRARADTERGPHGRSRRPCAERGRRTRSAARPS